MAKKNRESNFELLRIVSMLAIISIHYFSHGVMEVGNINLGEDNVFWYNLMLNTGRFGVFCFVMTTGYFMVNKQTKLGNIFKLASKVWTYAWGFLIAALIFGFMDLAKGNILKSIFPIVFKQYWFITEYFILYALIPFLNKFIHSVNKKTLRGIILVLFTVYSVIPTLTLQRWPNNIDVYYNIGLFVMLYFIAAYIKMYPMKVFNRTKVWVFIAIFMRIILWASIFVIWVIDQKFGEKTSIQYLTDFNSVFVIIESVAIFMVFRNLKIGYRKWINYIAASTLAVYLIHSNILFSDTMWKILGVPEAYTSSMGIFLLNFVVVVPTIFIGSVVIDRIRGLVLDKPIQELAWKIDKTKAGRAFAAIGETNEKA